MDQEAKQRREDTSAEAALWVVRLAEPGVSASLQGEFEAWRGRDPAHELAYERESRAWDRADALKDVAVLAGGDRRLVRKLKLDRRLGPTQPARRALFRRVAAGAAVVLLAGGIGVGAWVVKSAPAYATAIGERRLVILDDGSRIEMNTDTRLVVRYASRRRTIALERGEALFEVAPDKARPFVVVAGKKQVLAVGAAFNVRRRDQGIDVLVSKGVAAVGPGAVLDRGAGRKLTAGMSGHFDLKGDVAYRASPVEVERTLAWRYGAIVLDGETLDQAVAEFNRYNVRRLELADPSIAKLKLGGDFQSGDLNNFVQALKSRFGINVVEGGDQTLYLSRAR